MATSFRNGDTPTPPDQVDALDEILLPMAEAESGEWGTGKTGLEAFEDAPLTSEAKAKLSALLVEQRIDEENKYGVAYVAADNLPLVADRIKELEKQREATE